jgi:hypothetical protein
LDECRRTLEKHNREFKAIIREETRTKQQRREHLEQLIATRDSNGDTDKAKIIRSIKRAEKQQRTFQQCRNLRFPNRQGGLAHVLIPEDPNDNPKTCTSWIREDRPEVLEKLIGDRNVNHFSQSQNCTLTSPPLDFTNSFTGTEPEAEALLAGNFTASLPDTDQADISELTTAFLSHLQYSTAPDAIAPQLTFEEYKGKVKAWDEKTSTSLGTNMHLGHLKTYFAKHLFPEDSEDAIELQDTRDKILRGHLLLLNYSLKFGYPYEAWKMVVNTMLEKDPGTPKLHRLRVIHLYEADYNLILGFKWRAVLHHACHHCLINPSQYGSQPGKEAPDPAFLRILEYETARLTCKPVIHFDNNATSCYDRIPCFLANVASRKYGMHCKVCIVQGRALQEARYHLKTKLGISKSFIKHSTQFPWFGTGQGSGNSPMVWLFICSTLFDTYEEHAHGSTYESPDRAIKQAIKIVGFVDDTRNSTNKFDDNDVSIQELAELANRDSQIWHDLLISSNQALELSKCGYHAIMYDFLPTGEPILLDSPPTHLQIRDQAGILLPIEQWKNSSAAKYLGTFICIANNDKQHKVLMEKCNTFARLINCSTLDRTESQTFYWAIYRLSSNYPLPTAHFTFKELDKVQAKSHVAMVTHMGYNRTTSKAVLYGPTSLGGAGLFHLYDDQGYGQIKTLLKHWRTPDSQIGRMLRIAVAWAQQCSGTGTSIKLPHLECKWLASLRQFLQDIEGQIHLRHDFVEPLQRQHDSFLMDLAIGTKKFGKAELRRINYCRMYLGVLLLSDIVSADGKRIIQSVHSGEIAPASVLGLHGYHKVSQRCPSDKVWGLWRKFLNYLISSSEAKTLTQPLGKWLHPTQKLRRTWPFLYNPPTNTIYHRIDSSTYTTHQIITDPTSTIQATAVPLTAVPVDIKPRPYTWHIIGSRTHVATIFKSVSKPTSINFCRKLAFLGRQ